MLIHSVTLPIAAKKRGVVGNEVSELVGGQFVKELVYPAEVFESLLLLEASLNWGWGVGSQVYRCPGYPKDEGGEKKGWWREFH